MKIERLLDEWTSELTSLTAAGRYLLHCVSKTSHLWLAIILTHTQFDCNNFWQKCYWQSKKSDDALLSRLTYLVLQHCLAKEETQKTAHWCFVRATQSNCYSAPDFLFSEPCPRKAPSWTHWLQDLGSHTAAWVWVVSQKDWRNQAATGWVLEMH